MTSLGEAYGGDRRREASPRRLYAGVALFIAGALLVVAGIVVATTGVARGGGTTIYEVREYGGILAGLGVPAVFLGILTVLPSDRDTRAAAGVGAAIATLGVALFAHAYPCQWSGASCVPQGDLTLVTVGTYALGAMITFWYLFVGVATFKRRNDPGDTVRMNVTRKGETKVVEVDPRHKGTVGTLGAGMKQAAASAAAAAPGVGDDSGAVVLRDETGRTDGGAATNDISEVGPPDTGVAGDRYCGSCAEFEYVRTAEGMQPYCAHHDEVMDDMDPCPEWEPNRQ